MSTDSAIPVSGKTFLCVCLNPVLQKTLVYERLAPGEVNRTARSRIDPAGKGLGPTRVLAQLGERSIHLTGLGGPTRSWFLELCAAEALDVAWFESGAPIRFCTTLVETAAGRATELVEEALPVAAEATDRLFARYAELLPRTDAVLLSGTVASGYAPGTMGELARRAAAAGKRLYLDLKGHDLADCLASRPVVAKPNLEELAASLGADYAVLRVDPAAARACVAEAGRRWFAESGTYLVVTRGHEPVLYWDGGLLGELAVATVAAVNPIGSGDAFGAGLARALEAGAPLADAVAEGVRLGGLNAACLKPGSLRD
jgi:fructose-1-phosphate kinase PfkB-like protein